MYHRNARKPWERRDFKALRRLARENTPRRVISFKLGRTEEAVRKAATSVGVDLRRKFNQRPYER